MMTDQQYERDLRQLARWYRQMVQAGVSPKTVQQKIRALHAFCDAQADLIGALTDDLIQAQAKLQAYELVPQEGPAPQPHPIWYLDGGPL